MKKRIMLSLMIIGLVSALVGGATFAVFSSTATNAANTFNAGTVVIEAGAIAQTSALDITSLAPGDVYSGSFTVTNSGTLDAKLTDMTAVTSGALFTSGDCVVGFTMPTGTIAAGASITVPFTVTYDLAATVQGQSGTLSFSVTAEQVRNNP